MTRRKGREVVVGAIIALTLLQGSAAGVAWFLRDRGERDLTTLTARNAELLLQAERVVPVPVEQPVATPSKWRMLDGPDVAGTMQIIQGLGDTAGVAFDNIKAAQSNTVGKQSFQIVGRGTAHQACLFLAAVEQHDRLLVVETGRVLPGGAEQIVFEVAIATYHLGGGQ